jgi:hypothetical protein
MYQAIHSNDDNVYNVNFIDFNVMNFYCVLYSIIFEFVRLFFLKSLLNFLIKYIKIGVGFGVLKRF